MRILQIATQIPVPPTDGGKLSVFGITKNLSERGHQIDFVCYLKNDEYTLGYKLLSEVCTPHILNVQTENNIFGAFVNLFSSVPYNASKYHRKELTRFLQKFFSENNVDIIQIEHLHLGWVVDELRILTTAPIVLRSQNLEMRIMKRYYENQANPLLKYFAKLQYEKFLNFEPEICKKFDKCIMISKSDEEELRNFVPDINVSTIPAGVNSHLLKLEKKDVIPYSLVHIGHTDWYPNHDSLSWFINDILPELTKLEPRIRLFVYGGGKTKDFPLPDNMRPFVNIVGFVDNLWEHVLSKELAVVPLRIGGGIRIKILEMLAIGKNIVSTSIGKEGIGARHNKEILIADSREAFIKQILDFFNNKYDHYQMTENGKNFIKHNFTWEVLINKFEAEYNSLITKDKS